MEQREAEHMDKVAEQFTYLTSVIDGQAADQSRNMPVATSITLGSKELPYMLSIKAFGSLRDTGQCPLHKYHPGERYCKNIPCRCDNLFINKWVFP